MLHFQEFSEYWAGLRTLDFVDFRQFNLDLEGKEDPNTSGSTRRNTTPLVEIG